MTKTKLITLTVEQAVEVMEALEWSIDEYEKQDEETSNKQIDTWKLLEAARVW